MLRITNVVNIIVVLYLSLPRSNTERAGQTVQKVQGYGLYSPEWLPHIKIRVRDIFPPKNARGRTHRTQNMIRRRPENRNFSSANAEDDSDHNDKHLKKLNDALTQKTAFLNLPTDLKQARKSEFRNLLENRSSSNDSNETGTMENASPLIKGNAAINHSINIEDAHQRRRFKELIPVDTTDLNKSPKTSEKPELSSGSTRDADSLGNFTRANSDDKNNVSKTYRSGFATSVEKEIKAQKKKVKLCVVTDNPADSKKAVSWVKSHINEFVRNFFEKKSAKYTNQDHIAVPTTGTVRKFQTFEPSSLRKKEPNPADRNGNNVRRLIPAIPGAAKTENTVRHAVTATPDAPKSKKNVRKLIPAIPGIPEQRLRDNKVFPSYHPSHVGRRIGVVPVMVHSQLENDEPFLKTNTLIAFNSNSTKNLNATRNEGRNDELSTAKPPQRPPIVPAFEVRSPWIHIATTKTSKVSATQAPLPLPIDIISNTSKTKIQEPNFVPVQKKHPSAENKSPSDVPPKLISGVLSLAGALHTSPVPLSLWQSAKAIRNITTVKEEQLEQILKDSEAPQPISSQALNHLPNMLPSKKINDPR